MNVDSGRTSGDDVVHDMPHVAALREADHAARSRWRMTHVELDSAIHHARRGDAADTGRSIEAHADHRAALHDWQAAEAALIAARLGFVAAPLAARLPRSR